MNVGEILGVSAQMKHLAYCFNLELERVGMVDLEPCDLNIPWINNKVGVDVMAKRIDMFLLHSYLLTNGRSVYS